MPVALGKGEIESICLAFDEALECLGIDIFRYVQSLLGGLHDGKALIEFRHREAYVQFSVTGTFIDGMLCCLYTADGGFPGMFAFAPVE